MCRLLEHYGYELERHANHGHLYRHRVLAEEHPELAVRKRHAYVLVPRGNELREYAVREAVDSIDALLDFLRAQEDNR